METIKDLIHRIGEWRLRWRDNSEVHELRHEQHLAYHRANCGDDWTMEHRQTAAFGLPDGRCSTCQVDLMP